jgi:tryptophan synthase beta subunit
MASDQVIIMNMSGRGDKDVQQVAALLGEDSGIA